jgi:hypothetical protein
MLRTRLRRLESLLNHCNPQASGKPPPRQLQTVQDVIDLLEEQAEAVRAEPFAGSIEKARVLAYLAGVARRTFEAGVLAERVKILEQVLKKQLGEKR